MPIWWSAVSRFTSCRGIVTYVLHITPGAPQSLLPDRLVTNGASVHHQNAEDLVGYSDVVLV